MFKAKDYITFIWEELSYHFTFIFDSISISAIIGALMGYYSSFLLGEWYLVQVWFTMCAVDLILGVTSSIRNHTFALDATISWSCKLLVHSATIILVGLLTAVTSTAIDYEVHFVNGYVGFLIFAEAASLLRNAKACNLPIPPILNVVLSTFQDRLDTQLSKTLGIKKEELHECIEKVQTGEDLTSAPREGPSSVKNGSGRSDKDNGN